MLGFSEEANLTTVIIQVLRMIQFNVRNLISGIYHESNAGVFIYANPI